jgi:hypothetical protein
MKHRSYIFLFSIIAIFIGVGYLLLFDNKPKIKLEITFLLESPIAKYNDKLSEEVIPFVKVFESNTKELFFPRIFVKRLDIDNQPSEEINITKNISTDYSQQEVKKHFDKNLQNEMASPLMILDAQNNNIDYKDTIGFLSFFLVNPGSMVVDNVKYFDDAKRLSKHIENLLEDNYFENNRNYLSNALKIIIPKEGNIPEEITIPPTLPAPSVEKTFNNSPSVETTRKTTIETIQINLKLNENTNLLSWNNKLVDVSAETKIIVTLKKPSGSIIYNYDGTGKSSFIFDPNNSDFSGNTVDIEVLFNTNNDKYILNGNNKLFSKELKCSAN